MNKNQEKTIDAIFIGVVIISMCLVWYTVSSEIDRGRQIELLESINSHISSIDAISGGDEKTNI